MSDYYHTKTQVLNSPIPLDNLNSYIQSMVSLLPSDAYDLELDLEGAYDACCIVIVYKIPMTDQEISLMAKSERQRKLAVYKSLKKELGL